jgi:endonuclease-3
MSRDDGKKVLRQRAARIDRALAKAYGEPVLEADDDPVDTLVETILSQNTTDKNSHKAFLALKDKYDSWDEVTQDSSRNVATVIRSGGLAEIKAERIVAALKFIKAQRGRIELDFLRSMGPIDADSWLSQMKGVGPKTRSIVLLFSLGMPTFPVDTHVHRVSKRLGLIGPKVSREDAQLELAALVREDRFYSFHINLIEHGRAVCRARRPMCGSCSISTMCDFGKAATQTQT